MNKTSETSKKRFCCPNIGITMKNKVATRNCDFFSSVLRQAKTAKERYFGKIKCQITEQNHINSHTTSWLYGLKLNLVRSTATSEVCCPAAGLYGLTKQKKGKENENKTCKIYQLIGISLLKPMAKNNRTIPKVVNYGGNRVKGNDTL